MSVIQLCLNRIAVLAQGDNPLEPPAWGDCPSPIPPGLALPDMKKRVLVASNRGPVSYEFDADGKLTFGAAAAAWSPG